MMALSRTAIDVSDIGSTLFLVVFIYHLFNVLIVSIIVYISCTNNVLNEVYKYNQRQSIKFNLQALVIFSSILLPCFSSFGGLNGDKYWCWWK